MLTGHEELPTNCHEEICLSLFSTSSSLNSCGNSHLTLHLCVYLCPFGMKPRPIPEMVNSAQTPESQEIRKMAALKKAQKSCDPRFTRAKEKGEI